MVFTVIGYSPEKIAFIHQIDADDYLAAIRYVAARYPMASILGAIRGVHYLLAANESGRVMTAEEVLMAAETK